MHSATVGLLKSALTPGKGGVLAIWRAPCWEGLRLPTSGHLNWTVLPDYKHFSNRVFLVPQNTGKKQRFALLSKDPAAYSRRCLFLFNEGLWPPDTANPAGIQIREEAWELISSTRLDRCGNASPTNVTFHLYHSLAVFSEMVTPQLLRFKRLFNPSLTKPRSAAP